MVEWLKTKWPLSAFRKRYHSLKHNLETTQTQMRQLESQIRAMQSQQADALRLMLRHSDPLPASQYTLKTDHPVAIFSDDHNYPRGTANDNTRYPRFVRRISHYLKNPRLEVMDLGCSGGGLVMDFLLAGHEAIGLEGSDFSLISQRAEWPIIPERLFTCDITSPFQISKSNQQASFDLVTAWEVLEHIPEDKLKSLLENIRTHLKPNGLFAGSVAMFEDYDPVTGANWHVTLKPRDWWETLFTENGFRIVNNHGFRAADFPRGGGQPGDWNAETHPNMGFHIIVQRLPQ